MYLISFFVRHAADLMVLDVDIDDYGVTHTSQSDSPDMDWPWLPPIARAYHEVYNAQGGRDFIGMRDFYSLVKLLRRQLRASQTTLTAELLTYALLRNFNGKPALMDHLLEVFHSHCFNRPPPRGDHSRVLPLVLANLQDGASRHLMLLTQNWAATELLVAAGHLNLDRATVLVGSEFPDDRTEMYLVQQINEIKLGMAAGATIVLVNHGNIYESLYDVLNQRYLTKVNPRTKQVRRLLRLAIGPRSHLCEVGDGFRLIVVVDQQHAYDSLDLPLLNRFEKQVLRPVDMLSPLQRQVVSDLQGWVAQVRSDSKFEHVEQLFVGFCEGTLSSAVLCCAHYDDDLQGRSVTDVVREVQLKLLDVALPLAVFFSKSLQSLAPSYFDSREDLGEVLASQLARPTDTPSSGVLMVLLTLSSISHMEALQRGKQLPDSVEVAHLVAFDTCRQFYEHVADFLTRAPSSAQGVPPSTLLILCDPAVSKLSFIHHVQFIIEQCWRQAPGAGRHIVLMVHLPPGTRHTQREFVLDFKLNWRYYFVDDLRPSPTLNTRAFLERSTYELIAADPLLLRDAVYYKYQSALAGCPGPNVEGNAAVTYASRIQLLHDLLLDPEVSAFLEATVLRIICDLSVETGTLQAHVSAVLNREYSSGSLRQTLQTSLAAVVVQALTQLLQALDVNFNLHLACGPPRDLWLQLSGQPTILNPKHIAQIMSQQVRPPLGPMQNMGRNAPLVALFPFSVVIVNALNTQETRSALSPDRCQAQLQALLLQLFGPEVVSSLAQHAHLVAGYLHDLVAATQPAYPGLAFEEQVIVVQQVVLAADPAALQSIPAVHAGLWLHEQRIFQYSSLLSNLANLPSSTKTQLKNCIVSFPPGGHVGNLDIQLLTLLLDHLSEDLASLPSGDHQRRWLLQINGVMTNMDVLLAYARVHEPLMTQQLQQRWDGLALAMRLFVQGVLLPHDGLSIPSHAYAGLLDVARFCVPDSLSYLLRLFGAVAACLSADRALAKQLPVYILHCLLHLVFPRVVDFPTDLGEFLQELFNGRVSPDHAVVPVCPELQRVVLAEYLRRRLPLCVSSLSGAIALAEHLEDRLVASATVVSLTEEMADEATTLSPVEAERDFTSTPWLINSQGPGGFMLLLGQLKVHLRRFADLLYRRRNTRNGLEQLHLSPDYLLLCRTPVCVRYLLKVYACTYGIEAVIPLVNHGCKVLPWLPIDSSIPAIDCANFIDAFRLFCFGNDDLTFRRLCGHIFRAANGTGPAADIGRALNKMQHPKLALLAAWFSRAVLHQDMDPCLASYGQVQTWIRHWSAEHMSPAEAPIVAWFLAGCPLLVPMAKISKREHQVGSQSQRASTRA